MPQQQRDQNSASAATGADANGFPAAPHPRGHSIGDYVVEEALAATFKRSIVYRCHKRGDEAGAVKYAVKTYYRLFPGMFGRGALRAWLRFSQLRMLKNINHPNIVKTYDLVRSQGRHYLVMEYVDGEPLESFTQNGAPFQEADIRKLARGLLAAFAYIETSNYRPLIESDFKRENIMVGRDGAPRVIDIEPLGFWGKRRKAAAPLKYLAYLLRLSGLRKPIKTDGETIVIIGRCVLRMACMPLPDHIPNREWQGNKARLADLERWAVGRGYDEDLIGLAVASVADPSAVAFADWERILAA